VQILLLKHFDEKIYTFLLASDDYLGLFAKKRWLFNRKYQGFTTQYNVLFNGQEALKSELTNREKILQR
jgi:hypothetical protein